MKKRSHLAREIVETIALTLIIFLVIRFAIQSYRVSGISMQPGLQNDEYVVVNKMAYLFHAPERGDVIVFHFPLDTSKDFIKRIDGYTYVVRISASSYQIIQQCGGGVVRVKVELN